MTKLTHDQVDEGEDLAEGFGQILPGDARYSDYHCTDADGNVRPFLEWFYDGKDAETLRRFAHECVHHALNAAGIDGAPELHDAFDPGAGAEASARIRAFAKAAEDRVESFRGDGPVASEVLEDYLEAFRRSHAAAAVVALLDPDPAKGAKDAALSAKGAGVDPYVIGKIAACLHRWAAGP